MRASLSVAPVPGREKARKVQIACPCGTTFGFYENDGSIQLDDDTVTKVLLIKHLSEQPRCRCIRKLWRRTFGCPWPEVSLVAAGGVSNG